MLPTVRARRELDFRGGTVVVGKRRQQLEAGDEVDDVEVRVSNQTQRKQDHRPGGGLVGETVAVMAYATRWTVCRCEICVMR